MATPAALERFRILCDLLTLWPGSALWPTPDGIDPELKPPPADRQPPNPRSALSVNLGRYNLMQWLDGDDWPNPTHADVRTILSAMLRAGLAFLPEGDQLSHLPGGPQFLSASRDLVAEYLFTAAMPALLAHAYLSVDLEGTEAEIIARTEQTARRVHKVLDGGYVPADPAALAAMHALVDAVVGPDPTPRHGGQNIVATFAVHDGTAGNASLLGVEMARVAGLGELGPERAAQSAAIVLTAFGSGPLDANVGLQAAQQLRQLVEGWARSTPGGHELL